VQRNTGSVAARLRRQEGAVRYGSGVATKVLVETRMRTAWRGVILRAMVPAGCLAGLTSCFSSGPVVYKTDMVLKVCAPTSAVATASACEAINSDPATVRSEVMTRLEDRIAYLQGQGAVTAVDADEIEVRTTLTGSQDISALTRIGSVAFATAVPGAPDTGNASFIADQQDRFDASQFTDPDLYPPGYHWKIDTHLGAGDVTSAVAGTDSTTGQNTVDINFNSKGAAEWTRITNAAYAFYLSDPTQPTSQIGIFLDDEVLTAPVVTGGGQSNQTEITGNFTQDEANSIATLISEGPLPAEVAVVSINGKLSSPTP
jgi:preprotein translocase subunit SecD